MKKLLALPLVAVLAACSGGAKSSSLSLSALEAEQELEGKFVIDATTQNITLNFDPANWFVSGTTALDPADPANKLAIEANIRGSLAAFQDDDESGHENHHGDDDAADHDAGDDHGGGGGGTDDGGGHH